VLEEVDPTVLGRVLIFMDTGHYPAGSGFSDDVDLYLLALYLDIPALEALVISRCQTHYFKDWNAAKTTMSGKEFIQTQGAVDIFRKLFSKTPVGDGLRLILMRSILTCSVAINRSEVVTLFQVEEPNAWNVLCSMYRELTAPKKL